VQKHGIEALNRDRNALELLLTAEKSTNFSIPGKMPEKSTFMFGDTYNTVTDKSK